MKKQDLIDSMTRYLDILAEEYQSESIFITDKERLSIQKEFRDVVRAFKFVLEENYKNGKNVYMTRNVKIHILDQEREKEREKEREERNK